MVSHTTAVCALELKERDSLRPLATLCEVTDSPTDAITLSTKAVEKIGELLGGQGDSEGQALRVPRKPSGHDPVRMRCIGKIGQAALQRLALKLAGGGARARIEYASAQYRCG